MSGNVVGRFGSFGSLLYALHDIVIHSNDRTINDTRLFSPFPDSYRPTRRELFDAIARHTDSTWSYDEERGYWLFVAPAAPPAFTLVLAQGWAVQKPRHADIAYQSPPDQQTGMNISHIGTYSNPAAETATPAERQRFWADLRRDLALKYAQRFPADIAADDLVATQVGGHDAVYCVSPTEAKNQYTWHQWVFVAGGQGFLITCGADAEQGVKTPPAVKQMLQSFEATGGSTHAPVRQDS